MSGRHRFRARRVVRAAFTTLVLVAAPLASAEELTPGPVAPAAQREAPVFTPESPVESALRAGSFSPLVLPASVGPERGFAMAYGGYDSSSQNARLVSFADARIYGPLALRFGAQSSAASSRVGPSLAARVQVLSDAKHGVDTAVSLAYNAEGFTELEGEIELVVALGKTFGRWHLLGNLAYGQDPEGKERDGEVRAALLYRFGTRYHFGLEGRGRVDLGEEEEEARGGKAEPLYDLDVGPTLHLALGPVVFGVHAGFSSLQEEERDPRFGAIALAGLGTAL